MRQTHAAKKFRARFSSNDEPLYRRLPKHDRHGRYLSDFMMLIPGLRNLESARIESHLRSLQNLLENIDAVVFADLNLPRNLLWVSVEARNGVILEVSSLLRGLFPEAKLVGHLVLDQTGRARGNRFSGISDSGPDSTIASRDDPCRIRGILHQPRSEDTG